MPSSSSSAPVPGRSPSLARPTSHSPPCIHTDHTVGSRPAGNIELANIIKVTLTDSPTSWSASISPTSSCPVHALDVRYIGDDESSSTQPAIRLLRGSWDRMFALVANTVLPAGARAVVLAGTVVDADVEVEGLVVTVRPSAEAAALLDEPAVQLGSGRRTRRPRRDGRRLPVPSRQPCGPARQPPGSAGAPEVRQSRFRSRRRRAAVVAQRTRRVARHRPQSVAAAVGGGRAVGGRPRTAWEDLDFDLLRRHPGCSIWADPDIFNRWEATDLQVILSAIIDHVRSFGQRRVGVRRARPAPRLRGARCRPRRAR